MTKLKTKDLKGMSKEDINKKIKELKYELIKASSSNSKVGSSKSKEIKKTIARILTTNK